MVEIIKQTNDDHLVFGLGCMIIYFSIGLMMVHYTLQMFNYSSYLFNVVILYTLAFGILVTIFGFIFPSLKKKKEENK